ncbi:glycosyl hydrolase 53 family protein [Actinophytocola algeriensis]|uniref:Arabinogalactan endo-beta-1,4-galactanase n=1 Tax=Actinophytocola algeriensis TaxID=1768010 RepID=A0A7W7QDH7_9PSEU|nr:glycosyl hydrolase 53 family protein [Actinophytocola algeriensis]MBB4911508.1 arabinogalactan endo-1,4-beta-galactosidase [Actinophytocola algeriensis]MBE1473504.1 arabinogalactan endo-1,4-beta-galactosidase [Actinophytocola algeriensis]
MSGKRLTRVVAGVTTVAAMVSTTLLIVPAPAGAIFGTADIKPIESNIAAKDWASATAGSSSSSAGLAIDGDPATSWHPDRAGARQWLTVDLGGTYDNLGKVTVMFPDRGVAYRYVVEASSDGRRWTTIADRSRNRAASRGEVHLFTRPGTRFVRLMFTGVPGSARAGVSELQVFNYLRDDLVLGADLSWVDDVQDQQYWVHPLAEDRGAGPHLLDVAKDRGIEYARLRVFNEPRDESTGQPTPIPRQGPERSLTSAQWIKQRGMGLGIDFHYADSWADPSKQPKPRAWAELEFADLTKAVYDYTADYLDRLIRQGTTPEKVAVGNEIINGFLYGSEAALIGTTNPSYFVDQAEVYQSKPGGGLLWRYWGSTDPAEQQLYDKSWDRFTTLAAAGIKAVRDASPTSKVEIHVIVDKDRLATTMEFWHQFLTRVKAKGQNPDVLAISYYPEWHGTPEALDHNLNTITTNYPEYEIDIAETSYPASGGDGSPMPNSPFPRTVQGQADAIQRVFQAANDVVNNQASAVLVWEPAGWQPMFRAVPGLVNTWEPHASIDVFNASHAKHILQDTVYTATAVGAAPKLPSSVHLLTTATNRITSVPVRWQPLPPGATDKPGVVTVTGMTGRGPVTAVIDVVP